MNKILSKRYAFCDFSKIVGFPNPVPSRDEWENSLPRFRGEDWEVPAEHLLDFHDYIHRLQVVHEDVQIRLFCFSLEGIARDWYRSLPIASINSLAEFHAAFHLFCKEIFSANLLFPECCHEFNLLTKDSENYEEYVVIGDISHCDQDVDELHNVSHSIDAFDIMPNASIVFGCQENQIVPFEDLKGDEQIDKSTSESVESAVDAEGSSQFSGLQTKADYNRYLREGDKPKSYDQQSFLYDSLTEDEQSVFSIETSESNQQLQYSQLDRQLKEVFRYDIYDPVDNYLESMSSKCVKAFLSEEDCLYHLFKPFFCMTWLPLFFGSRSSMILASQLLSWLLWKFSFT
jgi:hypothetical protein